jgi:hypothetical protein
MTLSGNKVGAESEFILVKRYSELLEFYELLKKRYKTILIPYFPAKNSGRNSLDLVEHRRRKIERFFFNLFNLKHSNFSKKKILDIIGTIGVISFKKSITGNLKGLGSYFSGAVKNYIYDKLDKKEICQVYADLGRLGQNEELLRSVFVFIDNEARFFLKMDEKYFRFVTILNHFFSNKSVKEKNNLLESLNAFQEVEYLRKKQIKEVKIERLDQSLYQPKSQEIGPLNSSMDVSPKENGRVSRRKDLHPKDTFEKVTSIQVPDSQEKSLKTITQSFPQLSALYSNSKFSTLNKRKERENFFKENGQDEAMNVFKATMGKIQGFLDLVFEVTCELDEIERVKETIFGFFRTALDKEEMQAILNKAKTEGIDLPQVFTQK